MGTGPTDSHKHAPRTTETVLPGGAVDLSAEYLVVGAQQTHPALYSVPLGLAEFEGLAPSGLRVHAQLTLIGSSGTPKAERNRLRDDIVAQGAIAVPALLEEFWGETNPLRKVASGVLREMAVREPDATTPLLVAAVKGRHPIARLEAASALALTGPRAFEILSAILKDDPVDSKVAAIRGLKKIGETNADVAPLLNSLLDDPATHGLVKLGAVLALKGIDYREEDSPVSRLVAMLRASAGQHLRNEITHTLRSIVDRHPREATKELADSIRTIILTHQKAADQELFDSDRENVIGLLAGIVRQNPSVADAETAKIAVEDSDAPLLGLGRVALMEAIIPCDAAARPYREQLAAMLDRVLEDLPIRPKSGRRANDAEYRRGLKQIVDGWQVARGNSAKPGSRRRRD